MKISPLRIPDVLEIVPARFSDHRGFFSEVWNRGTLAANGIELEFVQDNHSLSREAGVIRGLHYQDVPAAQAKLVRVVRGSIFDVAVDIRQDSPTFGKWVGATLSAEAWNQLLVPEGFAHGFMTLEPDCEVLYKVSAPYSRDHDRAIRWDDPAIGIDWPRVGSGMPILSDKDGNAPLLADAVSGFQHRA